ncbi:MAG TPA: TetR/AcrR family transcriptional regulator [Methylovirgula sp.]|jgi:AcrR family transcriptional regulator|nr:TetR/AcrR family transcriptional regulator [Methylovirgula sp.]
MRQNENELRRSRGRPQIRSDEETRELLVQAAAEAFSASGYAGTCMATVAQTAGISTKTMYRLIPTKAELFTAVVARQISEFMLTTDDSILADLPLEEALQQILVAYGTLTLNEETIALFRLVIGESERFPEVAAVFYETAITRVGATIEDWLRRQVKLGRIEVEDPAVATSMLRGMLIMDVQRGAMLGQRPAPDAQEIAERARACAKVFLDGCRTRAH